MVYILLGNGFEEMEAMAPCDILRRGEVEVTLVSVSGQPVMGAHGIAVMADCMVQDLHLQQEDTVVLPGGWGGFFLQAIFCFAGVNLIYAALMFKTDFFQYFAGKLLTKLRPGR